MKAASILDHRARAQARLQHFLFEYIDGGSYAEVTLRRNIADLADITLRQSVLRDVSAINLTTSLLDTSQTMPVALAPVGLAGLTARRGEVRAACAAEAAGVPLTLSTVSACSISEVAAAAPNPFWFQLYILRDRCFLRDLVALAREAGRTTLLLTVDLPVPGARYRDLRPGLAGARHRRWRGRAGPRNGRPHALGNVAPQLGGKTGLDDFYAWMRTSFVAVVTWDDVEWVCAQWPGLLIIKGILDVDDARRAADLSVAGIVVSNHGGRQLDGVLSSVRALPPIADAVRDRLTVLADGGVRSGLNIVRLLALGAHGVLLGRAWAYALAADGEAGVTHLLALIAVEMRVAMALTGVTRIDQIGRETLNA